MHYLLGRVRCIRANKVTILEARPRMDQIGVMN